jgi:hypothetical protein
MNEREFADVLADVLESGELAELMGEDAGSRVSVRTYEEAGVLTRNVGLVVSVGQVQFQLTIVRA